MTMLTNDSTGARVPPSPQEPWVLWPCQQVSQGRAAAHVCHKAGLTVEPVHLGDLPALVVASQQRDAVRPLGFQCKEVRERLEAVIPSVYKVPLRAETAIHGATVTRESTR